MSGTGRPPKWLNSSYLLIIACRSGEKVSVYALCVVSFVLHRCGNIMDAHKKQMAENARREADENGGEIRQLAREMADAKAAGSMKETKVFMNAMTWMSCCQVYAIAASITPAGPITYELIMSVANSALTLHILLIARVLLTPPPLSPSLA